MASCRAWWFRTAARRSRAIRFAAFRPSDFGVGTDPAVGVYVDGIYAARSGASLLAFNDIDHIEVLKGPQGTLFGRNSAAGAISIVTAQPEDEFHSLASRARRRVRQAVLRRHAEHADRRQPRAAHQRRLQQERRLDPRCSHRPGPRCPKKTGPAASPALEDFGRDQRDRLLGPRRPGSTRASRDRSRARAGRSDAACPTRPTRHVSRSAQGAGLQRRGRQRRVASARPGESVHRSLVRLGGLPFQHVVAPVRHRQPRRRRRHQPDRHVLRHRQHRRQRKLLSGVQVLRQNLRPSTGSAA